MPRPREPMDQERSNEAIMRFAKIFIEEIEKDYAKTYFIEDLSKSTQNIAIVKIHFDDVSKAKGATRTRLFNEWAENYISSAGWTKIKQLLRQKNYLQRTPSSSRRLTKKASDAIGEYAEKHNLSISDAILKLLKK